MTARTTDGPPGSYILDLTPAPGQDFTLVSAAVLKVKEPNGTEVEWTVDSISNQTPTTIRLTHLYTVGIFPERGDFVIYAHLTIPTGHWTSEPQTLEVLGPFDSDS